MRFLALLAPALSLLTALASAQNAFTYPVNGQVLQAGQTITLKWTPSTPGTVTLILRSGAASDLAPGSPIASGITNSGSYTWTIPTSAINGGDYSVEIVDDSNPNIYNYTPQFGIDSSNTAEPSNVSAASSAATMTAAGMSSATAASVGSSAASMMTASMMTASMMTASMMSSAATVQTMMSSQTAQAAAATASAGSNGVGGLEVRGFAAAVVALGAVVML